jgi:hypothetical protein
MVEPTWDNNPLFNLELTITILFLAILGMFIYNRRDKILDGLVKIIMRFNK